MLKIKINKQRKVSTKKPGYKKRKPIASTEGNIKDEEEKEAGSKELKKIEPYALRISNVVCTAYAGSLLTLRNIQLAAQSRLDESVFPSSVSRMKNPETTISFFDTGKILCTGSPSASSALYAVLLFLAKLNKRLNQNYEVWNFVVQNIVSSFSLGYRLNVDMFYTDNKQTPNGTATYDPNLFRGCSYIDEEGLVFVLFASGKVVLTGAKTWQAAQDAYEKMTPLLEKYKLGQEYKPFNSEFKRTRNIDVGTVADEVENEQLMETDFQNIIQKPTHVQEIVNGEMSIP